MIYTELGKSGVKVSAISFGSMRWPSEQACYEIMNRGLDLGLNYVDASTGYIGGKSQVWTGRAVKGRRDEIYFSSKTHFGKAPKADAVRQAIDESLTASELEYYDFYQLWGLGKMEVLKAALKKDGMIEGFRKAQADGLIKHGLGFTFHGPAEVFQAAIDSGQFISATVSYNLMSRKDEDQIAYAGDHGVGVIIINPLAGGVLGLARTDALDFLRGPGGPAGNGPCHGALRFLLANRNITTAIVGFTAVEEVDQAVAAVDGADQLDEQFRQGLIKQMDAVKLPEGDLCTGCGYCKECPNELDVSRFMQAMRDFNLYGVQGDDLKHWIHSKYPHQDPVAELDKCTQCGQCEEKCPQDLGIIEQINKAKAALIDH